MRFRRRHAWGAILIALFALPVLRPQGIPFLERPVASFFAWFEAVPALNPRLWSGRDADDESDGPRARALAVENALLREHFAERLQAQQDLGRTLEALQDAGLDRLPRAVSARVLRSTDASGWRQSILIDRGEDDGLEPGVVVVSGPVLVGRVEVVEGRSALVKLFTDRQSRLEVAMRSDRGVRLTGFVRGEGAARPGDDLFVRDVRVGEDVGRLLPGTPVVTSNEDVRVPAGLLVGWITEVRDKDLDGLPTVRLRPAFDLARTTRVFVLLPPTGASAPK